MGSASIVLVIRALSSATKMPKRQRHRSGSSSSGSSSSSRKRRQAQTAMPPTPSWTPEPAPNSTAASPSAESDPFESDSTNTADSTPAPSSLSSIASPKLSKLGKVKAALCRKLPSGKSKKKSSIGSNSSGGLSDTSVEGDSPINTRKGRISVIPEVTVTPSTDSSTSASPAASVRTVFRIDPRTGKPAQQYDLHCLSPRSAANARQRQSRRTRNSSRPSSPQFPRRTSSLRHSDEFPFDPNTAVRQPDDSHLYQSNPSSPTACRQLSERPSSLEAPSITSNNSLDKPLPALPLGQRSSVIDFHAAGTATPAQVSPKPIKTDDYDTPRAPAWPLPVDRQSVYGPTFSIFDTPPVPPKDDAPTNIDDATPRARSGFASSQLSMYGFHYYDPLDDRVLAARLQQIRANLPHSVAPDGFLSVPTSTAALTNQFEDAAQSEVSTRSSFASALSTTASFMTAMEDVGGDADDEASATEGEAAAENDGLSSALLSPSENIDAALAETNINSASVSLDDSGIDISRAGAANNFVVNAFASDVVKIASDALPVDDSSVDLSDDINTEPLCVSTAGPPKLSCKLFDGKMTWEYDPWSFGYEARWKADPSIDMIKEIAKNHYRISGLPNDDISVMFLAEGSFNKVYTVTSIDEATGNAHECIFRGSLPTSPWYKIQSEVATMEYVRRHTKIPVPKIFAFDSSLENPLGLEWMLMEKTNGKMYSDVEGNLSFDAKVKLYRLVAEWVDELSQLRFDMIGALYHDWKLPLSDERSFKLGPLNTGNFNSDLRMDYAINRGPFASLEQYYHAHINIFHCEAIDPRHKERVQAWNKQEEMEEAGEEIEDEVPETRYTLDALARIPRQCLALQSVLPTALQGKQLGPGSTRLNHFDISKRNIFVDDNGNALALIDWEFSWVTVPANIPRYPPIIKTDEVDEPALWTSEEPKEDERLEEEQAWEEMLLKREFDQRLQELGSAHLKSGADQNPELAKLAQVVSSLDSMEDESYVESLQEEMRRLF